MQYAVKEDAEEAIETLNGMEFLGRNLKLEIAGKKGTKKPEGGDNKRKRDAPKKEEEDPEQAEEDENEEGEEAVEEEDEDEVAPKSSPKKMAKAAPADLKKRKREEDTAASKRYAGKELPRMPRTILLTGVGGIGKDALKHRVKKVSETFNPIP